MQLATQKTKNPLSLFTQEIAITTDAECIIGVHQNERFIVQPLKLSLTIKESSPFISDLDIKNIKILMKNITIHERAFLIERLCYKIAGELFHNFSAIICLSLTIHKPKALVHARDVYVIIEATRQDFVKTST